MLDEIDENCRGGNTVPPGNLEGKKRKMDNIDEIDIPPLEVGKKVWATFHWILTWNNYPKNWQDFFTDRRSLIEKLCVGEEICPTTGTPHLQGWLRLFKKNIPRTHLGLPKQIHWTAMSRDATEKQNTMYCTKGRGNILTWGIPSLWKRTIKDMKPWMAELLTILSSPLEEGIAFRTVYWLWEPAGNTGKTVFQQAVYHMLEGVVAIEGKATDVKHFVADCTKKTGATPKIIFLNVPRCDQEFVSYGAIEKVKDMFFMSGKYEGSLVSGPRPHVMVFANTPPEQAKMSADRWQVGQIVEDQLIWQ